MMCNNSVQSDSLCCSYCFTLGWWEPVWVLSSVLWTWPQESPLLSGMTRCSIFILHFPCLWPRLRHFSEKTWFVLVGKQHVETTTSYGQFLKALRKWACKRSLYTEETHVVCRGVTDSGLHCPPGSLNKTNPTWAPLNGVWFCRPCLSMIPSPPPGMN